MSFGISVLPPHIYPSTNDRPPVGPLEMSHSEHDDLVRSSSTWALPSLAYRREALCSRGYRAPNPFGATVCSSGSDFPLTSAADELALCSPYSLLPIKAVHTYLGSPPSNYVHSLHPQSLGAVIACCSLVSELIDHLVIGPSLQNKSLTAITLYAMAGPPSQALTRACHSDPA